LLPPEPIKNALASLSGLKLVLSGFRVLIVICKVPPGALHLPQSKQSKMNLVYRPLEVIL